MVQEGDESFLIADGRALKWSPAGYTKAERELNDRQAADAAVDRARLRGRISFRRCIRARIV